MDRFYGGLQLGMDVFQVEGVDPILEEDPEPNFPTWLIPFIVIAGLVIIAALVMVYFSTRKTLVFVRVKLDKNYIVCKVS